MADSDVRVLIVDDEPDIRALHRAYLARLDGFQVVGETGSAREALDTVVNDLADGVDLVLLDLTMPDGHGLEVARHLRARRSDVDIIAITGIRDADMVRRALTLGVAQYLIKPFTFRTFADRLELYLDYRRRSREASGQATQEEVDALLSALRPPVPTTLPKGIAPATLETVSAALRDRGPLSAVEAAEQIGMSRVAVRRYLEYLADAGRASRHPRYGTPGRPEVEYRWQE